VVKKIYVGNLPFESNEEEIKTLFEKYGSVSSVKIVTDRYTGKSRGFGFVEMENADSAIKELNGTDFGGREIRVNEAREQRRPKRFRKE